MNWITSDSHYFHKNICKGSTTWEGAGTLSQSVRDFTDEFEMTEHLIEQINKYVQPDDVLYHLGDWSFGGIDKIWKARKRLNVQTIHLIYGNHDQHIKRNKTLAINRSEGLCNIDLFRGIYMAEEKDNLMVPAQNLFTSCQDRLETVIDGRMFVLDHYSMQVWNGSHKGVLHCFGHSHSTIEGIGRSMDVGVDNAFKLFGEYRPFSAEEVIKMLDKKKIQVVDHHGSSTNFAGLAR